MKVNVTFRHMDADDEIKSYATEKVQKLSDKYLRRPQDATVVLSAEKFRRIAEIKIKGDSAVFTGKEVTEDLKSAVDLVLDKLDIQARKHRTKYKTRKKGGGPDGGGFAVYRGEVETVEEDETEPRIIREDRFVPKPLTIEDALLSLGDSGDDFIVFRDADTFSICVLFRRTDGNFGLIEPENQT